MDEIGLSGVDTYKGVIDDMVRGSFDGLGDANLEGSDKIELFDDILKGAVSSFDELEGLVAADYNTLATELNRSAIDSLDDLGFKDSGSLKASSKAIANGTMEAMGKFQKEGKISEAEVETGLKSITEASMGVLYTFQKEYFSTENFGTFGAGFVEGLSAGLAGAGWDVNTINNAKDEITTGFKSALADQGVNADAFVSVIESAAEFTASEMETWCTNEQGTWDSATNTCNLPELSAPEGIDASKLPTEEQTKNCDTSGGVILWKSDGTWVCDTSGGAAGGDVQAFCDYDETTCNLKSDICEWTGSSCSPKTITGCAVYPSDIECNNDTSCSWDWAEHICKDKTSTATSTTTTSSSSSATICTTLDCCNTNGSDQSSCNNTVGCLWNSVYCVNMICSQFTDQTSCGTYNKCYWSTDTCIVECHSQTSEAACGAHAHCMWYSGYCMQ